MTYGYEIEPQADTAARLAVNVSIPKPLLLILTEYARALPIEAAHAVRTDNESILVYWVSGSSLVSIESRTKQPLEGGLQGQHVTPATGKVRPLSQVVLADIEGQAVDEPGGGYTVYRSVKIHFDDETVKLPDDRILPLDTKEERKEVGTFLDALLAAIDINEPLDTGEPQ